MRTKYAPTCDQARVQSTQCQLGRNGSAPRAQRAMSVHSGRGCEAACSSPLWRSQEAPAGRRLRGFGAAWHTRCWRRYARDAPSLGSSHSKRMPVEVANAGDVVQEGGRQTAPQSTPTAYPTRAACTTPAAAAASSLSSSHAAPAQRESSLQHLRRHAWRIFVPWMQAIPHVTGSAPYR